MRRLFSRDPLTGITKYFRYNHAEREDDESFTIETVQEATALVDRNRASYNNFTSIDRWGDGRMVASIPISLWASLRQKGIVQDERAFKRWLNDPDNRFFRTSPGRV